MDGKKKFLVDFLVDECIWMKKWTAPWEEEVTTMKLLVMMHEN